MVTKSFGGVIADEYIAELNGEKIDLSVVPARLLLKIRAEIISLGRNPTDDEAVDYVVDICKSKNPNITKDMILDLPISEFTSFVEFVMKPINDHIAQQQSGAGTKNVNSSV